MLILVRKLGPVLGALAFVTAIITIALFVAILAVFAPVNDSGGSGAAAAPVCTPGEGPGEVQIPNEYIDFVEDASSVSGVAVAILGAQLQQESGWNPKAVSPVGAKGLAQFMPGTWATFGEGGDPFDPEDAIAAQGRYMKYLFDFMEPHNRGDDEYHVKLILAGYNAGQGAVASYDYDLDKMFNDPAKPDYKNQTQHYVEVITDAAAGNYTTGCTDGGGGAGDVVFPLPKGSWTKTSDYKSPHRPGHRGIDYGAQCYVTDLYAVTDGTIVRTGSASGFGQWIVMKSSYDDVDFVYGHMSDSTDFVAPGEEVTAGTKIATVGTEGRSTGCHLHFETWNGGRFGGTETNPGTWLKDNNAEELEQGK